MLKRLLILTASTLACACGTPRETPVPAPGTTPERSTVPSDAPSTATARPDAPAEAAVTGRARVSKVSTASTPKAYRVDGAKHLYAVYADRIFKGKLPPLMHAVVVTEVELDAAGNVRDIQMVRVPSHAPEVVVRVRDMIRAASPLPAPQRMGGTRYTDVWLVDKSGRFQLDTLTEGQL
jgi:periplasmic protein TonB